MRLIMLASLALALAACSYVPADGYAPTVNAPRTTLVPPVQYTPVPTVYVAPTPTPYVVDRTKLELLITTSTNTNLFNMGRRETISGTRCIQDGTDGLHFICNLTVVGSPATPALTVKATCDPVTDYCIWRPE